MIDSWACLCAGPQRRWSEHQANAWMRVRGIFQARFYMLPFLPFPFQLQSAPISPHGSWRPFACVRLPPVTNPPEREIHLSTSGRHLHLQSRSALLPCLCATHPSQPLLNTPIAATGTATREISAGCSICRLSADAFPSAECRRRISKIELSRHEPNRTIWIGGQ